MALTLLPRGMASDVAEELLLLQQIVHLGRTSRIVLRCTSTDEHQDQRMYAS